MRMSKVDGFYLYEWRVHAKATQQDVADALGIYKGYVSELENGKKRYNQDHLEALAKFFKCDVGDLLTVNPLGPQPEAGILDLWQHKLDAEKRQQVLDFARWKATKS